MAVETVETPARGMSSLLTSLKTLGIAAGIGLIAGLAAGWIAGRSGATPAAERSASL